MEPGTISPPDAQPDVVSIPMAEFQRHVAQVNVCIGVLNGIMSALAQNPMFAGFLPAELRARIAELSD